MGSEEEEATGEEAGEDEARPTEAASSEEPRKRKRRDGERRKAKAEPLREKAEKAESNNSLALLAYVGFVAAAAIGVYSFVSVAKEGELRRRCSPTCVLRPNYAGYEKKAPNFTLRDTAGREVSLADYRGKVVVLNFWTKTCQPCMEEMPEIADLARILRPMPDVAVLTISTDDTAEDAKSTLKAILREEPPFGVLIDPDAKVVREKYGTSLYPETWIIDKNGVIRTRFDGAREWSSATVVELVDQIRSGGYCPAEARDGKFVQESKHLCENVTGG